MSPIYSPPTETQAALTILLYALASLLVGCGAWTIVRLVRGRTLHLLAAATAAFLIGVIVAAIDIFAGGHDSGLFSIFMPMVVAAYLTPTALASLTLALWLR